MMRKVIVASFCLVLMPAVVVGQRGTVSKVEFGLWAGASNYVGDIRASYKNQYKLFSPALGGYYRYNMDKRWAWRLTVGMGSIHSADSLSENVYEQTRNLSFRSRLLEASTQLDFNFKRYELGSRKHNFTPYMFIGFGVFLHNPQALLNGEWHDLQPLGTEGQNYTSDSGIRRYRLYQVAIPYGGGFKWSVSRHLTLGFEVGYRATFTDYLDDISSTYYSAEVLESGPNGSVAAALADRSPEVTTIPIGIEGQQRGNSRDNDAYMFSGITISYTFRRFVCPWDPR
jgi:hypothetical protein